jgi:hypothetical protein
MALLMSGGTPRATRPNDAFALGVCLFSYLPPILQMVHRDVRHHANIHDTINRPRREAEDTFRREPVSHASYASHVLPR